MLWSGWLEPRCSVQHECRYSYQGILFILFIDWFRYSHSLRAQASIEPTYVAQPGMESTFLPQLPKSWDYRKWDLYWLIVPCPECGQISEQLKIVREKIKPSQKRQRCPRDPQRRHPAEFLAHPVRSVHFTWGLCLCVLLHSQDLVCSTVLCKS